MTFQYRGVTVGALDPPLLVFWQQFRKSWIFSMMNLFVLVIFESMTPSPLSDPLLKIVTTFPPVHSCVSVLCKTRCSLIVYSDGLMLSCCSYSSLFLYNIYIVKLVLAQKKTRLKKTKSGTSTDFIYFRYRSQFNPFLI